MSTLRLENVTAEVSGTYVTVELGVSDEGLDIGPYGTLPWPGTTVSVGISDDGCAIRTTGPTGAVASFLVPPDALGGPVGTRMFARWLLNGAVRSGAFAGDAVSSRAV